MNILHIVNENYLKTYEPSPESLELEGENARKLKSEDFVWNQDQCPPLTYFAAESLGQHFEKLQILNELPCEDKFRTLENIPVDLPLDCAINLIDDEFYWSRRYSEHFKMVRVRKFENWTWKELYLERHVAKIVEEAEPQYNDEENLEHLELCAPYVKRLFVTQLQMWKPPNTMEKEDIPVKFPIDHINFEFICKKLPLVEEFCITYGMRTSFEDFDWRMFEVSVLDCQRLGKSLLDLPNLKILKIQRSKIEYFQCQALMKHLIKNTTLVELDLSNCPIGDRGALCVAKVLGEQPTLEILNLTNCKIGQTGAEGIVSNPKLKLVHLNLRLNPLLLDGTMGILRAIVRCERPYELILSGCQFADEIPQRIGIVLKVNETLQKFDISNNWFGEEGGELLIEGLKENKTLQWLDVRETDITKEQEGVIKNLLLRNRNKEYEETEVVVKESEERSASEKVIENVLIKDIYVESTPDQSKLTINE